MRKLTVDDISDLRAYERERAEFRARIIEAKKARRIALGELMTVRVREHRHDAVPDPGDGPRREDAARRADRARGRHLQRAAARRRPAVATLFVEITDPDSLREWLPKLVGSRTTWPSRPAGSRRPRSRSTRSASPARTRSPPPSTT